MKLATCAVLLHEIYGVNTHMAHYKELLEAQGIDVYVPNLLQRDAFTYAEEQAAYTYFTEQIGFTQAADVVTALLDELATRYTHIRLIGFSVGATVAWLCSTHSAVSRVVCLYGSRIRQYTDVQPTAPTVVIFCTNEPSFAPRDVAAQLAALPNVTALLVDAAHGFANPNDAAYDATATSRILPYILAT